VLSPSNDLERRGKCVKAKCALYRRRASHGCGPRAGNLSDYESSGFTAGIPGRSQLLPSGRRRLAGSERAALERRDVDAQDPGAKHPSSVPRWRPVRRPRSRTTHGSAPASEAGSPATAKTDLVAGRAGFTATEEHDGGHRRPRPGPGAHDPQGAAVPAPGAQGASCAAARPGGGCPPGAKLARLGDARTLAQAAWAALMARMRRKTLAPGGSPAATKISEDRAGPRVTEGSVRRCGGPSYWRR